MVGISHSLTHSLTHAHTHTHTQVDSRGMRPKSLIAEIEAIFDERQEQMGDGSTVNGPHLILAFPVGVKVHFIDKYPLKEI